MKPQAYSELREYLDSLSIFAGRNPLVRAMGAVILYHVIHVVIEVFIFWCMGVQEVAELKEEDIPSDTVAGDGDPSSILSESHSTHMYIHKLLNVTGVLHVYTGIDDLFEVKTTLKNVINWIDLGLALGLCYPTLQKIDDEKRGKVNSCIREMLAAWLQKEDNVGQVGIPSWCVLQTALRKIGENELADTVHT